MKMNRWPTAVPRAATCPRSSSQSTPSRLKSATTRSIPSRRCWRASSARATVRSEEHTSELQSLTNLVCRLLLEKKKKNKTNKKQDRHKQKDHNGRERNNYLAQYS